MLNWKDDWSNVINLYDNVLVAGGLQGWVCEKLPAAPPVSDRAKAKCLS